MYNMGGCGSRVQRFAHEKHQVLNLGVLGNEQVLYRDSDLGSIEKGRSLDMSWHLQMP